MQTADKVPKCTMTHQIECEDTRAPTFWLKLRCGPALNPETHQSLHFCGLDYTTLFHLLESSESHDGYTIRLYLSLMEKNEVFAASA